MEEQRILGDYREGLDSMRKLGFDRYLDSHNRDEMEFLADIAPVEIAGGRNFDYHIEQLRKLAEDDAQYAQRLEEWAGILHDHPVSLHYALSHEWPRDDYSPRGMVRLEDRVARLTKNVEEAEGQLEELTGLEAGAELDIASLSFTEYRQSAHLPRFSPVEHIISRVSVNDPAKAAELRRQWADLVKSDTTLEEIKEFHTRLFKSEVLDKLRQEAEQGRQILDDVKNGRTSPPPGPTNTSEQQAA